MPDDPSPSNLFEQWLNNLNPAGREALLQLLTFNPAGLLQSLLYLVSIYPPTPVFTVPGLPYTGTAGQPLTVTVRANKAWANKYILQVYRLSTLSLIHTVDPFDIPASGGTFEGSETIPGAKLANAGLYYVKVIAKPGTSSPWGHGTTGIEIEMA